MVSATFLLSLVMIIAVRLLQKHVTLVSIGDISIGNRITVTCKPEEPPVASEANK